LTNGTIIRFSSSIPH